LMSFPAKINIAFISGPIDTTPSYFATHYILRLNSAVQNGASFVMGPVQDTMAREYLLSLDGFDPKRTTVCMAQFEYADETWRRELEALGVNVEEVSTGGRATTTRMRDEFMTGVSGWDVLRRMCANWEYMCRTEEEAKEFYGKGWWPRVSNTEINGRRRGVIGG
ncbi:hypothetical protein CC80DRAFT_353621, partial [Byssothecium circinans]